MHAKFYSIPSKNLEVITISGFPAIFSGHLGFSNLIKRPYTQNISWYYRVYACQILFNSFEKPGSYNNLWVSRLFSGHLGFFNLIKWPHIQIFSWCYRQYVCKILCFYVLREQFYKDSIKLYSINWTNRIIIISLGQLYDVSIGHGPCIMYMQAGWNFSHYRYTWVGAAAGGSCCNCCCPLLRKPMRVLLLHGRELWKQ